MEYQEKTTQHCVLTHMGNGSEGEQIIGIYVKEPHLAHPEQTKHCNQICCDNK